MTGTPLTNGAAEPGAAPPPPPPPPAEGDRGQKFVVHDERSAGNAIAGLLFGGDDDAPPAPPAPREPQQRDSGGDPPQDTGADESRPTGDDDQGSGEPQPSAAAIEPPASWNADEKSAFAQLPPTLQQTIARRETQREATLNAKSMEAADNRKAFEAERGAAVAQRTEYLAGLQKMLALAVPEAQALANVDWVATQAQSPAEYTRLLAMRDNLRERIGAIEGEFQRNNEQLQIYQRQALAEHVEQQRKQLIDMLPEYGDEAKAPALRSDLGLYLRDVGKFSVEEINAAYDHRLVVMAHKAMLYDRQQADRASADAKRNNPAPQVVRPGNSQQSDRGPDQRLRAKVNQLGRTNSVRDAGSLIAELL